MKKLCLAKKQYLPRSKGFALLFALSLIAIATIIGALSLRSIRNVTSEADLEITAVAQKYSIGGKLPGLRSKVVANLKDYITAYPTASPSLVATSSDSAVRNILAPSTFDPGSDTYSVECYREGTGVGEVQGCTASSVVPKFFQIRYSTMGRDGLLTTSVQKFQFLYSAGATPSASPTPTPSSSPTSAACLWPVSKLGTSDRGLSIVLSDDVLRVDGNAQLTGAPFTTADEVSGGTLRAGTGGPWSVFYWLVSGTLYYSTWQVGQPYNLMIPSPSPPALVPGLSAGSVASLTQSGKCLIMKDNTVKCWDLNYDGQIGNGTIDQTISPYVAPMSTTSAIGFTPIKVSSKYTNACALSATGVVKCWGAFNGSLNCVTSKGKTTCTTSSTTPQTVTFAGSLTAIDVDTAAYASEGGGCAVMADGTVQCWGDKNLNGFNAGNLNTPSTVPGITNATNVAVGSFFACARISDGTVKCWGGDHSGQVSGTGGNCSNAYVGPTTVANLPAVSSIVSGQSFACGITTTSQAFCWGYYKGYTTWNEGISTTCGMPTRCVLAASSDTGHQYGVSSSPASSPIAGSSPASQASTADYTITSTTYSNASFDEAISAARQ